MLQVFSNKIFLIILNQKRERHKLKDIYTLGLLYIVQIVSLFFRE